MEPKDWCTMSVASLGPATLDKPQARFPNGIARPMDIEQERTFAHTFTTFRSTFNNSSDIFGSAPKRDLSHSRNCFHTLLAIDDIPGTRPKQKSKMLTTERHVNPLQPSYSLPSFTPNAAEAPRFLRDSMSVTDIDGAQTTKKKPSTVRDALSTVDISGAQASWKPRHSRARLDALPHDIMSIGIPVKNAESLSKRVTDPVAPEYFINGRVICDDPKDTKPLPLKKFQRDSHLLMTHDISGATAIEDHYASRREFRNTNFLGDISGAQADSIKHSIVTKRETNPLNPRYPSLDDGAVLSGPVTCLIPADVIKVPTVFHQKINHGADSNEVSKKPSFEVSSYADKLTDESDRIDGRPPPIPIDKLRLSALDQVAVLDSSRGGGVSTGRYSYRDSGRSPSVRNSSPTASVGGAAAMSARSAGGSGGLSQRSPVNTSRKPSLSMSARRAVEERQMEIESVRGL